MGFKKRDREAIEESIAADIWERMERIPDFGIEDIREISRGEGWEINIRLPDSEYIDADSYTRISNYTLDDAAIERVMAMADEFSRRHKQESMYWKYLGESGMSPAQFAEEHWYGQLRSLHRGDQRRKDAKGMSYSEIADELAIAESTLFGWLNGHRNPSRMASKAIDNLYRSKQ